MKKLVIIFVIAMCHLFIAGGLFAYIRKVQ